jgi:hypothetical protein
LGFLHRFPGYAGTIADVKKLNVLNQSNYLHFDDNEIAFLVSSCIKVYYTAHGELTSVPGMHVLQGY